MSLLVEAKLPKTALELRRMMQFLECNIISNFKFFDHRLDDTEDDHYYMEREWRVSQNVTSAAGPLTITDPNSNGCPTEKNVVQLRHSRARQCRSRRRSGHRCGSLNSQ